jgi:hypothetical protein
MKKETNENGMTRRDFLRRLGLGAGSAVALSVLEPFCMLANDDKKEVVPNQMARIVELLSNR